MVFQYTDVLGNPNWLEEIIVKIDAADWSLEFPAIFTKCTAAYHDLPSRHITKNYADYFFAGILGKLQSETLLF